MLFFSFAFLVASSVTLGQLYLYWRLFRKLIKGRRGRLLVILVMTSLSALVLLRRPIRSLLSPEGGDLYSVGTYSLMALALALVLGTAASDLIRAGFFVFDVLGARKTRGRKGLGGLKGLDGLAGLDGLKGAHGSVGFEGVQGDRLTSAKSPSASAVAASVESSDSLGATESPESTGSSEPNSDSPTSTSSTASTRAPDSTRSPKSTSSPDSTPSPEPTQVPDFRGSPKAAVGTESVSDPGRRAFILRTLPSLALAGGALTAGYGGWRAFDGHRIKEVPVHVPRLPKALDGYSIVHLSDLHVGPFIDRSYVEKLVQYANALKPDLVAITGDLVDGSVRHLGPAVAALQNLRSRHGTYFVTGNHDYYSGDVEWCAFLESIGIHVLRNRHLSIGDAGGRFDLVGVDDWSGGRWRGLKGYDLDLALSGRDQDTAAVLLAHQPANFHEAAARGIDLQLSGHTHGGQIFPGTLLVGLQWEYVAGLYQHQDSNIFVSRGSGFWGPPLRVGSPPEIVKIILTA